MAEAPSTAKRWAARRAASAESLTYSAVFLVAFALRVLVPFTGVGLVGNYSYDSGVYYAAGAALVRGRVPYRDFILLHPPGVALATAPAAWIGRVTNDHVGYAFVSLEFIAFGAASAVLVVVAARRLGAPRWAATTGGLFYAGWFLSVRAEYVSRLEPLGNLLLLCGLVAYTGVGWPRSARSALACGAALGAAASVKVWYAVPLAVVVCFLVARHRTRDAGAAIAGAIGAVAAICGAFFALAPTAMWRMVVSEQIGRQQANALRALLVLNGLPKGVTWQAAYLLDAVLVVLGVLLALAAWRTPAARLPAVLLVACGGVLVAAPSFFAYYTDYLTPAAALCIATGAASVACKRGRSGRVPLVAGTLAIALLLIVPAKALWYQTRATSASRSPGQLASAVSNAECVMSDSPMALIQLNVLDRTLADGCPDWVDVTGRTYAPDMSLRGRGGSRVARAANTKWQRAVRDYLLSGNAVVVLRPRDAGISPSTLGDIAAGGVLATDGVHTIYRVSP